MKIRYIKTIVLLLGLFLMVSCGTVKMNTTDLFKNEKSFKLTLLDEFYPFDTTVIKSIQPESTLIIRLKKWIGDNSWGWLESPYPYDWAYTKLEGSNFRFLIYPTFVAITYKDTKGKMRQFFKDIDEDPYSFYYITSLKKKHKKEFSEFDFLLPEIPL